MQLTDEEWEFIAPYLPIGEYGPYPFRLRQQFEGVVRRFRAGARWRETPAGFGAWSTVHNRFRQWRDAEVFEALLESLIAEPAKRGGVDLPPVGVDSRRPYVCTARTSSARWAGSRRRRGGRVLCRPDPRSASCPRSSRRYSTRPPGGKEVPG